MDINGIARLAGVSRATVSRYLNDGYVSKEKRAAIAKAIEETGYVPSRQAQQLRTGKTHLVGVIIPKLNSQSVSRMVSGITEVLEPEGYQTLLADTNNNAQQELDYLRIFSESNRVDGIILLATVLTDAHRAAFSSLHIPLVVLGQQVDEIPCVFNDNYHAAYDITRATIQGSQCPAFIGVTEADVAAGLMRHKGFVDACASMGVSSREDLQLISDFTADGGYQCCEQIMNDAPQCDAIVCATDTIAYGALTCLREYGHRVPEDVQVSGIGDSEFSQIIWPSLTTAHLFYKSSGAAAAQLLIHVLERDESMGATEIKIGYDIFVRSSTR